MLGNNGSWTQSMRDACRAGTKHVSLVPLQIMSVPQVLQVRGRWQCVWPREEGGRESEDLSPSLACDWSSSPPSPPYPQPWLPCSFGATADAEQGTARNSHEARVREARAKTLLTGI